MLTSNSLFFKERVNRRRSTSRTAGDLTTDVEVEFTPDSLKVDNSYLNRVFFSKNKNGDEEDDELNDQSGSENVNDGGVCRWWMTGFLKRV